MKRDRPKSIIWFDRLFLLFVSLTAIGWITYSGEYFDYYGNSAQSEYRSFLISLSIYLVGFAAQLLSWFYAAYRGKSWAKRTFIALWALGLLIFAISLQSGILAEMEFSLLLHGLLTVCVGCLLWPGASHWFLGAKSQPPKAVKLGEGIPE